MKWQSIVATVLGATIAGALSPLVNPLWAQTQSASTLALMPLPAHLAASAGQLAFSGALRVQWQSSPDAFLQQAVARLQHDLQRLSGLSMGAEGPALQIEYGKRKVDPAQPGLPVADERYQLEVTAAGIKLQAETELGVLRGLATLRQLLRANGAGFSLPLVAIQDQPRFAWRGVMIDTARHFQSLPTLRRQIDAMELTKLNVLHLHLNDNEAFRFQSRAYPKLTAAVGNEFYTPAELAELVAYARDRGVAIVPELDVPGHAAAIVEAYPDYASGPVAAGGLTGAALDVTKPATYTLVKRLLDELVAVFPSSYVHIGGDEVSGKDWLANPQIHTFMQQHGFSSSQQLQGYFFDQAHTILDKLGKKTIGWQEVADQGHAPTSVVVQAWRSANPIASATARGNQVIVSAGYYLDYLLPAADYYAVDPTDPTASGIDPAIYAQIQKRFKLLQPFFPQADVKNPDLKLSPEQQQRVLGGEGVLWAELVTDEMLDGRLWPRMASLAERFWSPANVTDPADMYRRLSIEQDQLRVLGLADLANQNRMLARLAPGQADALQLLAQTVAPVRNFAHMHKLLDYVHQAPPQVQHFNQIADAALPDDTVADHFNTAAAALARGDHSHADAVLAQLGQWRDNQARIAALWPNDPTHEPLLTASANVASVAAIGFQALTFLRQQQAPDAAWLQHAREVLAAQDAAAHASSSLFATIVTPHQPAADLLITIVPGVRSLLDAAAAVSNPVVH